MNAPFKPAKPCEALLTTIARLRFKGVKSLPVELCRSAPWHFDDKAICQRIGGKLILEETLQFQIRNDVEHMLGAIVTAVPNGTHIKSRASRGKAQREGLRAGYPDLIIDGTGINAGRVVRAEIKAGGSVSLDQAEILTRLTDNAHKCGVFRSPETLIAKMREWGWR